MKHQCLILFERHGYETKLTDEKRELLERDVTERTGMKCVIMPHHIVKGVFADNVLLLWSYHSYYNGGRIEEEKRLSDKIGVKCVLVNNRLENALPISFLKQSNE